VSEANAWKDRAPRESEGAEGSASTGDSGEAERPVLLDVRHLRKTFPITSGFLKKVVGHATAVDDVSFVIREGDTLGLVGESGCGKTTTGRCILRAIEPTSGEVLFRHESGDVVDVAKLDKRELKLLRRHAQMIFQDPYSSLNPRWTLLQIVGEPLVAHGMASGRDLEDQVADLLRRVGLRSEYLRRYPHAFSGGERQRIGIARALALRPSFVVADEPVSALDVSVRAQTLNLLADLQDEFHLTYLFISHDLSVVQYICDRVAVMYVGKLVEMADTQELYFNPRHPYTEALLSAVPKTDPDLPSRRIILEGEVPDASRPPTGCYFHPRCRYAIERCRVETPGLEEVEPNHFVACHRARELSLEGIPDEATLPVYGGTTAWPNGSRTK
jgi:peptide/nickel transport system ATP-binding protein